MNYLPVFLQIHAQPCLVVGAGNIAARKIELLGRAGAVITVIAPEIKPSVDHLKAKYPITIQQSVFTPGPLDQYRLVIAATSDENCNIQVSTTAKAQGIPVNVVDNPALSSFIFPAIVDRSPLMIAIGSGGAAPVLARLLRTKLESLIPSAYGELAQLAASFRNRVKQHISSPTQRRLFWEEVLQGHIAEEVLSGNIKQAKESLAKALEDSHAATDKGEVYLIGAGPGSADLMTFRALRLLQQADVVVYDRLVSPEILDLARRDAEKIYVGKQRDHHTLPQTSINALLAELAHQGKRIARLKGGDPFIFGRGGEEIETLMQEGISFQIVPGITAASGCASYSGIPLTHRDHAQSCVFVTGHLKDGNVHLNWTQLAQPNQTIVIYMGSVGLKQICESLIAHGSDPCLPIALIQKGTTRQQKVDTGTLVTLPERMAQESVKAPTLIIIGHVVRLHDKLRWFGE
jgi:uroporphyrin-III C-methyltransferase / precorrin-2 dehydrogenase / sirohydrochlorin ferrochelatase